MFALTDPASDRGFAVVLLMPGSAAGWFVHGVSKGRMFEGRITS